jgi:hypothetical protein
MLQGLTYGKNDWKTFFKEGQRQWHNADFRLPYVLSIGQNADDLSISRKIAKIVSKLSSYNQRI